MRTDVYAMGVVLYEALTGRQPFKNPRVMKLLKMHVQDPPPPFREVAPDLEFDPRVEQLVARALAKKPEDRFEHAGAMAQAIEAIPGVQVTPAIDAVRPGTEAKSITRRALWTSVAVSAVAAAAIATAITLALTC